MTEPSEHDQMRVVGRAVGRQAEVRPELIEDRAVAGDDMSAVAGASKSASRVPDKV